MNGFRVNDADGHITETTEQLRPYFGPDAPAHWAERRSYYPQDAWDRSDIPMLAEYFMARAAEAAGLPPRRLSPEALARLQSADWPGNVRPLRNVLEWLLFMAPGDPRADIGVDSLPPEFVEAATAGLASANNGELMVLPIREAREHFERAYLQAQLERFSGNISRTASFVGMERSALHRKLKSLNIHTDD